MDTQNTQPPSYVLEKEGFVILDDVLPQKLCAILLSHLEDELQRGEELVASGNLNDEYLFGNIKNREKRYDMI